MTLCCCLQNKSAGCEKGVAANNSSEKTSTSLFTKRCTSKCEDRMQDEYTIPVCGLFIVWETSFPYDKNAPRGCALGAGVDGCRSNRASARECAKAHSFFYSLFVAPCGQIPCSRENLSAGSHEAHSNVCAFMLQLIQYL